MSLYEKDFVAWSHQQAEALRSMDFKNIDLKNLVEEIDDLGKSQRDALRSHLIVLLLHMIKMEVQSHFEDKSSWETSIRNSRIYIEQLLLNNPGLKSSFNEHVLWAWPKAIKKASIETKIPLGEIKIDLFTDEELRGE